MKTACRALGTAILIMGFIGSIGLAWSNGIVVHNYVYRIEEERSAFFTFIWFAAGMIVTAAFSIVLFALGEVLEVQESIAYRVSLMENASSSEKESANARDKELLKGDGSWKCVNCGRVNPGHTGTCGCGQSRNAL